MEEEKRKQPFLDVLSGECRALADRFSLSAEQTDTLRQFVTTVAMRSWRNGRSIGWARARDGKPEGMPAAVA